MDSCVYTQLVTLFDLSMCNIKGPQYRCKHDRVRYEDCPKYNQVNYYRSSHWEIGYQVLHIQFLC